MKIIITSDIHGRRDYLDYILENYEADYYIDCGDSELSKHDLDRFICVKGNCDFENLPIYRIVKLNGLNIFVTHSHKIKYKDFVNLAKVNDCKIVLYGHTHKKQLEEVDGITIINPGSVSRPRGGNPKTFGLLNYNPNTQTFSFEFVKINL